MIEIEVPVGWRAVAYRVPALQEWILDNDGNIKQVTTATKDKEIIITRVWVQPSWFPRKGWLYFNGVNWFISIAEPTLTANGTYTLGVGTSVQASFLAELFGQTFIPPSGVTITDLQ